MTSSREIIYVTQPGSSQLHTVPVFLLLPTLLLQLFHSRPDNKCNYGIANIKEEKTLPDIKVHRKSVSKSTRYKMANRKQWGMRNSIFLQNYTLVNVKSGNYYLPRLQLDQR